MLTKKQKKQFIKDILKVTKLLTYKVVELENEESNLFEEIRLSLKTIELQVGKDLIK